MKITDHKIAAKPIRRKTLDQPESAVIAKSRLLHIHDLENTCPIELAVLTGAPT
ncbi:MAG: hypothetical protein ACXWUF_10650 [Methylomagnum sp.]